MRRRGARGRSIGSRRSLALSDLIDDAASDRLWDRRQVLDRDVLEVLYVAADGVRDNLVPLGVDAERRELVLHAIRAPGDESFRGFTTGRGHVDTWASNLGFNSSLMMMMIVDTTSDDSP